MTPPRFQFTIRGMLWATFWAAVSLAAFGLFFSRHDFGGSNVFGVVLVALEMVAGFLAAFVAVWALFGKAIKGLQVGIYAIGGLLMLLLFIGLVWYFVALALR